MAVRGKMGRQDIVAVHRRRRIAASAAGVLRGHTEACDERVAKSCGSAKTEISGDLAHRARGTPRVDKKGVGRVKSPRLDHLGDAAKVGKHAIQVRARDSESPHEQVRTQLGIGKVAINIGKGARAHRLTQHGLRAVVDGSGVRQSGRKRVVRASCAAPSSLADNWPATAWKPRR